ncbi:MAG: PLP-dependent aminotransferase family protein [Euzebya sp.]
MASLNQQQIAPQWLADRLHDWPDGSGPMYLRLAGALERLLHRGEVHEGARLPAERQLAAALQVSRTTVAAAYEVLEDTRLVQRRHGSGTYITGVNGPPPPAPRESMLLRSLERNEIFDGLLDPPQDLLDFRAAALHDSDPLPESALQAMVGDLRSAGQQHGYVPAGLHDLRAIIAQRYTSSGLPTSAQEVLITSGAQQAIALITMLHLRSDDRVVTECLTHTGAIDLFNANGATIQTVPTIREGADLDAVIARLCQRPRMLYLVPSIHNPVGSVMPARNRRRLAAVLAEHPDVITISDDTLADTWRDRRPPPPLASYPGAEHVLHTGSVSKLLWGGLRIGWVRGPAPEIRRLARLKALSDLGTSIPAQLLAIQLLSLGGDYEDERRALIARRGRHLESLLAQRLPEWTFTVPQGGLCLWIQLPGGSSARGLAIRAARHGVAIAPGSIQSPDGGHGDHIRLPYGHCESVLDQAVHRLAAAWAARQTAADSHGLEDLRVFV